MSTLIPLFVTETGLSEPDVRRIIQNAPLKYKVYQIAKHNGGFRTISQPSRELKALQRVLIRCVLSSLPVHPCAMAYRTGTSIRQNAAFHSGNGPIKKYDFLDFFPSIVSGDWRKYCEEYSVFSSLDDIAISTLILFRRGDRKPRLHLAIGAPSSPILSNVLMYNFDSIMSDMVSKDRVRYTRYADDLTFSAARTGYLTGVDRVLRRVIRKMASPSLKLNEEKTILATRKYRRSVTGLILTNDGQVSLGHDRKRNIRAAVHQAGIGKLDRNECAKLGGLLAFVSDVEPEFLGRLKEKYGANLIAHLQTMSGKATDK